MGRVSLLDKLESFSCLSCRSYSDARILLPNVFWHIVMTIESTPILCILNKVFQRKDHQLPVPFRDGVAEAM